MDQKSPNFVEIEFCLKGRLKLFDGRKAAKRFRAEFLRQSDQAQPRVLIRVRKETSPAIERVPISPPHLLRIVALSRQPDLHGECTYGRLSRAV